MSRQIAPPIDFRYGAIATDSLEIIGMLNGMPASWSSIKDNRDRGK